MDAIIKAKELGEAIAESEAMKRLRLSDAKLQGDPAALTLIKEYKQLQIELARTSKEKRGEEAIEYVKELLIKKQQQLYENEITNEYLEAKAEFDRFMKNINDVITFATTGEVQCSPDRCGSCGGCK